MSRLVAPPEPHGALVAAGAMAALALAVLLGAGVVASACTETIAQPDDAGPFPMFEGGHPPPSHYGSPCELDVYEPEPCCGEVAKVVPGRECYGCTGKIAFALCVGGGFSCACRCDLPPGYALLGPTDSEDCGATVPDAPSGDAPIEAGLPEASLPEAGVGDAPQDSAPDVEDGALVDVREGGGA